MNKAGTQQKRMGRRILMGMALVMFVWCGLLFWVFSDPGRRELVRRVLINIRSGEMRGPEGTVREPP